MQFDGKSVLDIGSGSGAFSFYAAIRGAKNVVCLEPQEGDCVKEDLVRFQQLSSSLTARKVHLRPIRFQEFNCDNEEFDIILLHNSVNHLDEVACANMHLSDDSKKSYEITSEKLSRLATRGGKLIVADSSRYNFFETLRVRNPFAPSIEWHKHQPPESWSEMLSNYGFRNPRLRWTSFSTLGKIGEILFGNRCASYFLTSHFILDMNKSA